MRPQPSGRRLIILEGPDGGGKTALAVKLAKALNARHVRCGPFLRAGAGLGRLYVEAMLPALLGYQDVILDRAWPSEAIYGPVVRNNDRLGPVGRRMLERLALRCQTVMVRCQPPLEACLKAFGERPEYLAQGVDPAEARARLTRVWHAYTALASLTCLPLLHHDWTLEPADRLGELCQRLQALCREPHDPGLPTGGNLAAPTLLVGEALGAIKPTDPLFRAPFVSFDRSGCSWWLTEQLQGVRTEHQLLWANADDLTATQLAGLVDLAGHPSRRLVVGLGALAAQALRALPTSSLRGLTVAEVPHPQHHKRFHAREPYALLALLKEQR